MPFRLRMRPCWPCSSDIHYRINWNDGNIHTFWGKPTILYSTSHAFDEPVPSDVKLTAVKDRYGRAINESTDAQASGFTLKPMPTPIPIVINALCARVTRAVLPPSAAGGVRPAPSVRRQPGA